MSTERGIVACEATSPLDPGPELPDLKDEVNESNEYTDDTEQHRGTKDLAKNSEGEVGDSENSWFVVCFSQLSQALEIPRKTPLPHAAQNLMLTIPLDRLCSTVRQLQQCRYPLICMRSYAMMSTSGVQRI